MDSPRTQPRYALVIRVPRTLEVQIEDAFLTLVGITRPIMGFHITLVGPFVWTSPDMEGVLSGLSRLCLKVEPFELSVGGSGAFVGEEANAVYLQAGPSPALMRLQSLTYRLLRPHIALQRDMPPESYVPHVTLGLNMTAGERDRALAALSEQPLCVSLSVVELQLMEEQPNSPWRAVLTFPLAGQPPAEPHLIHEQ